MGKSYSKAGGFLPFRPNIIAKVWGFVKGFLRKSKKPCFRKLMFTEVSLKKS